ncbi:MAG: elongation factor Ts [Alphaproteobacteria bacterium]|nr:elongation factor Ts [Alphaproteobacteria bacterium]
MTAITPALIKDLREKTGAGMMDCKAALNETKGDMDAAVDWLRTKGLAAAAKKAGRVAAEGLVAVASDGSKAAIVEVNSETDFVARNDQFQQIAKSIAQAALKVDGDFEKLKAAPYPGSSRNVADEVAHMVGVIGENLGLRRSVGLSVSKGVVADYVHSVIAPGLGKIAVLVALESEGDKEKLKALGRQIAMHIAAAKPESLTVEGVDAGNLERERQVLKEQAMASGKPADVAEKMVEGRIRKYYEQVVLLEQLFVIDGKTKVKDVVAEAAKEIGKPVTLSGYAYFVLGEGIEKKEEDFAAEVAKVARA